jgi:hypothetical protein
LSRAPRDGWKRKRKEEKQKKNEKMMMMRKKKKMMMMNNKKRKPMNHVRSVDLSQQKENKTESHRHELSLLLTKYCCLINQEK